MALQHRDDGRVSETRAYRIELKSVGEDGSLEGYGSVFDTVDAYDDCVAPGAFGASLASHRSAGTMPAMLWQHDATQPIGVWTEMSEDAHGLRVKGKLALETRAGKEAHVLCKMGAVNGLSIGFVSKKWDYNETGEVRMLREVDLWEVSLVTFPANTESRVTAVKNARGPVTTIREAEQALRDAGLSAAEAKEIISAVKKVVIEERDARDAAAAVEAAAQRVLNILNHQ